MSPRAQVRAFRAAAAGGSTKSGYLPTVRVSERRWVVPTAALLRMLGFEAVTGDE